MTATEDLQSAIAAVADASARRSSASGRGSAAPASSSPTAASSRTRTTCAATRSPSRSPTAARTRGTVAGIDVDGDLAVINVDTAGATALDWARRRRRSRSAPRRLRRRGHATAAGRASPSAPCPPSRARSAAPAAGGSTAASSTPRRSPPGSSGGALLDAGGKLIGINTNRLGEGFYLALPADAALRERIDALGARRVRGAAALGIAVAPSHVARRLRRSVGLPGARRPPGPWRRGRQPGGRPGSRQGDLSSKSRASRSPTRMRSSRPSRPLDDPYEVRIVRGTDERTVTVGGGTTATGEA